MITPQIPPPFRLDRVRFSTMDINNHSKTGLQFHHWNFVKRHIALLSLKTGRSLLRYVLRFTFLSFRVDFSARSLRSNGTWNKRCRLGGHCRRLGRGVSVSVSLQKMRRWHHETRRETVEERWRKALCNSKLDEIKNAGWRSLFVKNQLKEVMHPMIYEEFQTSLSVVNAQWLHQQYHCPSPGSISTHNCGHQSKKGNFSI